METKKRKESSDGKNTNDDVVCQLGFEGQVGKV